MSSPVDLVAGAQLSALDHAPSSRSRFAAASISATVPSATGWLPTSGA